VTTDMRIQTVAQNVFFSFETRADLF
jgi:hypothetical protein